MSPCLKKSLQNPTYLNRAIKGLEEICYMLGIDISDLQKKHRKPVSKRKAK